MMHFTLKKWLQVIFALMLCHSISCECILPEIDFENGTVTIPNYYEKEGQDIVEELSVIQYTCSDGYIQIGPEFVQCFKGKWLSEAPLCLEEKCPNPPYVKNATFVIEHGDRGEPIIGSYAVYSCKEGYELVNANASTLRCIINVESRKSSWEGDMPTCEEKQCIDPGVSDYGERSGDCCSSGDTLTFSCHEGYELVGDKEMHCLGNGVWSSGRPRCRQLNDYCEFPSSIPHGFLRGKKKGDYFVPGEEAEVLCEPGFKYDGNKFITCGEGGVWKDDFKECKEIFCGPPTPIAHGTIPVLKKTNLTIFPYDFKIFYVCDKGYRIFSGEIWRTCSKSGWSGRTPRCQVVRCSDPGTPDNGSKIGGNYSVGSSVRFSCSQGYNLLGSDEIFCNTNGQWVGEIARCNIPSNYCPDPGTPINGFKNMTEYKKGDRVRFRCQAGHILLGSDVRECLANKTWSGTRTTCVGRYDFDSMKEIRDRLTVRLAEIKETQRKELQEYQEALFTNLENSTYRTSDFFFPRRIILYFAFDVSGSVPLSIFEKSIEFAKAIVRKVGISLHGTRAGAVAFSSKAEGLFLPLIYASTKDVLAALSRVNYTGGGTAISSALSWIRTESIPMVKEWHGDREIKNFIFVFTDGKTNMGGDPKREADLLKADGAEIFCIGITGDVRKKVLYDIASYSKYEDEIKSNVFIFQDYRKLAWLVEEIKNDTANHSTCGLGMENVSVSNSEIIAGNVSTEQWPWMAALYIGKGRKYIKCGGSIIHQQFILTAAHCLYDQNRRKRGANETIVKLGLKDLQDVTYLQQFKVRNIHEHEQYRNGTNMDYDIALLELEKPITYNAFVKPICLPEKVMPENFYKTKTIAWAIGWDDTQVVPNQTHGSPVVSQVLKEFRLIIQSRETCNESLRDNSYFDHFTERMFCAGSVEGKNYTCVGDVGGPVMQPRKNDKGYLEWTQVGLVSWELGYGLKNEYGYYIRLNELIPWVHNTIEEVLKLMKN